MWTPGACLKACLVCEAGDLRIVKLGFGNVASVDAAHACGVDHAKRSVSILPSLKCEVKCGRFSTLKSQPSTVNSKPSTLNPQPSNLNPQSSTLNHRPSALNPQPSALNPQPSALNPQPSNLKIKPFNLHPTPQTLAPNSYATERQGRP